MVIADIAVQPLAHIAPPMKRTRNPAKALITAVQAYQRAHPDRRLDSDLHHTNIIAEICKDDKLVRSVASLRELIDQIRLDAASAKTPKDRALVLAQMESFIRQYMIQYNRICKLSAKAILPRSAEIVDITSIRLAMSAEEIDAVDSTNALRSSASKEAVSNRAGDISSAYNKAAIATILAWSKVLKSLPAQDEEALRADSPEDEAPRQPILEMQLDPSQSDDEMDVASYGPPDDSPPSPLHPHSGVLSMFDHTPSLQEIENAYFTAAFAPAQRAAAKDGDDESRAAALE
jgi:hypothetical protein